MRIYSGDWYTLYNGDCMDAMRSMPDASVDMVLTSPPYNTCRTSVITDHMPEKDKYINRYDVHVESRTSEEYCEWTKGLFHEFARLLKKDSVVLYNYGMGNDSHMDRSADDWLLTMRSVVEDTEFTCADMLFWKKRCALPENMSPNHATRIVEPVMVFVRKSDRLTFRANKPVISVRKNGNGEQRMYRPFYNLVEAANNDGANPYNKATFSTEFCERLMDCYLPDDHGSDYTVMDPFSGTGTTGMACLKRGVKYVGMELSENQCAYSKERFDGGATPLLF